MKDDAGANAGTPSAEPQETEIDYRKEYESLTAQYKGVQRTNERLSKEIKSRIVGEEQAEHVKSLGRKLDMVLDVLEKSGFSDAELAAKVKAVRVESAQAESRLKVETEALSKIAEIFAKTGVDFEDVEVAKAYFESGNYDKAIKAYERAAAKVEPEDGEGEDDVTREAAVRAVGKKVDTGKSTVTQPVDSEAAAKRKLAEIDKIADPKERSNARWALLRDMKKG